MQRIRHRLTPIALFLRFEYLVFALMLPVLGAASVLQSLGGQHVIWLLLSAFCIHVFISLQNDIFDLRLDRTDPRRKNYPLVKGTVSVKFASALVLLQIPLVAALTIWWGTDDLLVASVIIVLGMMSIYNIWGKRTKFPILIDLVQGIGFAGLVLFGAASSGNPTLFSLMAFLGVVIWMMQTNHLGGIRDLRSDYRFPTFTTPICLGSRVAGERYLISKKCKIYSYILLVTQFALPIALLWRDKDRIDPAVFAALVALMLLVLMAAVSILRKFFEIVSNQFRLEFDLAYVVMYLSALPMLAMLAVNGNSWVIISAGVVILAAFRTYRRISQAIS